MYRMGYNVAVLVPSTLVFALVTFLDAPAALAAPARLRVRLERRMLAVGEKTRVTVEFLDQGYHAVPNDRIRSIALERHSAGSGPAGSGEIAPTRVTVPQGALSSSEITFTARATGRLTIQAASDGLAPGEELLNIVPRAASLLSRILLPPVYAESAPSFQLIASECVDLPVNGSSTAHVWVTLDAPIPSDRRLRHARVTTSPFVSITYAGKTSFGLTDVVINEEGHSELIDIQASAPGRVKVSAELLSTHQSNAVEVEFKAPRATRILIGLDQLTVPSNQRLLPLTVKLGDQHGLEISVVDRVHEIDLSSATNRAVAFDPSRVTLAPNKPAAPAIMTWDGIPSGTDLRLLARDRENDLEAASATVRVTLAGHVLVLVAALGGVLGGLARHVYRTGTPMLWPGRLEGRLHPGVVGNALFGSVFGLVLFQAAQLGFLYTTRVDTVLENRTLAFFLGVMGGVGGILIAERLIDRILPETKAALAPSPGLAPSRG